MKTFLLFFCFLLGLLQSAETCAQKENENIHHIINKVTERTDSFATEKIYVQTDKPYYAAKDTMWFSMYLFNASRLSASSKSSIAYIEIADEENKVKRRMMVSLYFGLGWGNFVFKESEFPQGNYTVRAYTNWMRNFDENYIFTKQFYISSPGEKDLLINTSLDAKPDVGETIVAMNLQVKKINQQPLSNSDFQLKITDGNRIWFRDKAKTSSNGSLDFNFTIPGKVNADKLFVTLQSANNMDESPVYKVPVIFNRRENIDLQFMPEGGYLVAGVPTHVAFKALGEDGNGASVSISVYNRKGDEVLASQSAHLGMGSFNLQSKSGENYIAKIKFADGTQSKEYALPAIKSSGIVLNIENKKDSDSLEINISASADVLAAKAFYYLMGESRGLACYGAGLTLDGSSKMVRISKTAFATGIAHFTLLNENRQPLNERLVYINRDDHLRVNVNADKMDYGTRDSVGITMAVTDKNGLPVQGSFSVSVTEDAQVKIDSLKRKSIRSVLFLSSDLKGHIEDPGYYFPSVMTNDIWQHLDNLLLTQGWVNYDWATLFQPLKKMDFPADTNFSIKGKVTNILNKPVEYSSVVLLSKTPMFVKTTITNAAGVFDFPGIYPSDSASYFLQSRNKNGKSFNVGIVMDEFQPPVFSAPKERVIPWYVNVDSNKIKSLHTLATYRENW
ncbi:MAG: carboxypeptidase-like regulatory domain-containing protein, partial [Ginsengibacter sp.]